MILEAIDSVWRIFLSIAIAVVFHVINIGDRAAITNFAYNDGRHSISKRSLDMEDIGLVQYCRMTVGDLSFDYCSHDPYFICCSVVIDRRSPKQYYQIFEIKDFAKPHRDLKQSQGRSSRPEDSVCTDILSDISLIDQNYKWISDFDDEKYRRFDGGNNNLEKGSLGAAYRMIKSKHSRLNTAKLPNPKPLSMFLNNAMAVFQSTELNYPPILRQFGTFIKNDLLNIMVHKCAIFNTETAYLDQSNLYGLNSTMLSKPVQEERMPLVDESSTHRSQDLFWIGYMRMIWRREHDRLVRQLRKLNPAANDTVLQLAARKIAIAEYQHIVYNEWLPLIIGIQAMQHFRLFSKTYDYEVDYSSGLDASISAEFSLAAEELKNSEKIEFYPLDDLMSYGRIKEEIEKKILLGRTLNLPSYNYYRRICGLEGIRSFYDLPWDMTGDYKSMLRKFYKSVEDIDLYLGLIAEKRYRGSLLGPIASCIVAEQFHRLKFGDRFWYENSGLPNSFTPEQLDEIRKVSLRRIVCDNDPFSDRRSMPNYPLLPENKWNQKISCDGIDTPNVSLDYWKGVL